MTTSIRSGPESQLFDDGVIEEGAMTMGKKAKAPDKPGPVSGNGAANDEAAGIEAVDVGDTALIAIEKDIGNSTTVIQPQPAIQSGNTRKRIEDYMEMKRAARELHDLDDFDH